MPRTDRPKRKTRIGIVISDKMNKTITVRVDRAAHHAVYNKLMRNSAKFRAHDEEGRAKEGDIVRIQETRPLSRTKRWRLVEVLKKGSAASEASGSAKPDIAKKISDTAT